jgi:hypothetical protein
MLQEEDMATHNENSDDGNIVIQGKVVPVLN